LKLVPFHPDGVGGLGFAPALITRPIIVTLLIGAIPTAGAFEVHRRAAITPLMGATVIIASACFAYLVPILFLRADIVAVKRATIVRLRGLQQAYYSKILQHPEIDVVTLREGNEAIEHFEKMCVKVQSISNCPHLKRVTAFMAIALAPSVVSVLLQVYDKINPLIHPAPKTP